MNVRRKRRSADPRPDSRPVVMHCRLPEPHLRVERMMIALQSSFTVLDWVALGLLASLLVLIAFGIFGLRQEIRSAARVEAASREGTAHVHAQESP